MTECLDMMDVLSDCLSSGSKKKPQKRAITKVDTVERQRQYSISSQKSSKSHKSDYVDIAYSQQIKKVRKSSFSSLSSTSSMERSFHEMEKKMKRRQQEPELLDQKYMISGYLQMSKDYKKLLLTLRAFLQTLRGVLQYSAKGVREDKILEVDQYFEKHSHILQQKVADYFKLKESLHRLLRMKIQEPYFRRVKRKIQVIEKSNAMFELFRVYLEAFDFIKFKGFENFKDDLEIMKQLKKPPTDCKLGAGFEEQIEEIRKQIEGTKDFSEGDVLSKVFEYKLNQVQKWEQLLIQLMQFRYIFNVRYNLSNSSQKILKSKKLYDQLISSQEAIDQFLLDNYAMSKVYLKELSEVQEDLELMKSQIVQWNLKLRNEEWYKRLLQLVKFNLLLKKSIRQLENIVKVLSRSEEPKLRIRATDIVVQVRLGQQNLKELLQQLSKDKRVKEDEYLQKQFNKSVIQYGYFQNLKADLGL